METNNLDVIKQAVLYTKQNNLVYKKVYASSPPSLSYLAIKVISKDPATILPTDEQDEDYFVRTFLSDGTEDWPTWSTVLTNKDWFIVSATETKQKGTKTTNDIKPAAEYQFKTEFLDTQVSKDRPRIRPFGFLENAAVPAGGSGHNFIDRAILGLSGIGPLGLTTPKYEAVAGAGSTFYKGVVDSGIGGTLDRKYSATNAATNMIQNYFFTLGDNQKIIIGWSGGPFADWWEDKYTMSAVKETGEMDNYIAEDNPEAVATFNQIVPMKADYNDPNFLLFYRDKKKEFLSNPDTKKGNFTLPLPTEDDLLLYGFGGKTFYELGLETDLTPKEVDSGTVNALINKLMGQIKNEQSIDEIEKNREQAKKDQLKRGDKALDAFGNSANIFTNLFKKVDN
jgi:hypothetical protein